MKLYLRIIAGLVLLLGLSTRVQLHRESRFADDDALITFRYADNLAAGRGFVYNTGERVLGTTTPLFTCALALGLRLGIPPGESAITLDLAGFFAAGLLLYLLLERRGRPWQGLIALLLYSWSVSGLMLADIAGMETPVYVSFLMLAFFLYAIGHTVLSAVAAALATLTRPDGALVALALGLAFAIERRRLPLRELAAFVAVCLPWAVFAQAYFGSILPHSMAAKHVFAQTHWMNSPLEIFRGFFVGRTRAALGVLALGGAIDLWIAREWKLLPVVLWPALYVAAFVAGGVLVHYWYLPPLFTPLLALAAVAMVDVPALLASPFGAPGTRRRTLMTALFALPFAVVGMRAGTAMETARAEAVSGQRLLDHVHREIGFWVAAHTGSGARVYAADIGYVGYVSGRRILDAVGLVSPEAVRWNARRDPVGLIREQRPDLCVVAAYGRDYPVILADAWFSGNYQEEARFRDDSRPGPGWADTDPRRIAQYVPDYRIYRRNPSP